MSKGTPSYDNAINVRIYSNSISLPQNLREKLSLNENLVLKYKFLQNGNVSINKVSKITRKENKEITYRLRVQKNVLEKEAIKQPTTSQIEILDKKQLGYRPIPNTCNNKIFDVVNTLDSRFTCFEEQNDFLTIYFLNNRTRSIACIPRFIRIDNFSI